MSLEDGPRRGVARRAKRWLLGRLSIHGTYRDSGAPILVYRRELAATSKRGWGLGLVPDERARRWWVTVGSDTASLEQDPTTLELTTPRTHPHDHTSPRTETYRLLRQPDSWSRLRTRSVARVDTFLTACKVSTSHNVGEASTLKTSTVPCGGSIGGRKVT